MPQLKRALVTELRARLEADLVRAEASQKEAQAGATHEESRPENDKDTRALESTYLARGLAQRVSELRTALTRLRVFESQEIGERDVGALSALVTVEDEAGGRRCYFIAPVGGGVHVAAEGVEADVVTPTSPLGGALLGKRVGDEVTLGTGDRRRTLEIVALR